MDEAMHKALANEGEVLGDRFDATLRSVAKRCIRVWFARARLDEVLGEVLDALPECELVYAIDVDGRQVSSNILPGTVDASAYGQDLASRPIAVSLSALQRASRRGAFLCDAYVSRVTRRPCVTVMYSVTSGSSPMGFIAADFDPGYLAMGAHPR